MRKTAAACCMGIFLIPEHPRNILKCHSHLFIDFPEKIQLLVNGSKKLLKNFLKILTYYQDCYHYYYYYVICW